MELVQWQSEKPTPLEREPEYWWMKMPVGRKGWSTPEACLIWRDKRFSTVTVERFGRNSVLIDDPEFKGALYTRIVPHPEED